MLSEVLSKRNIIFPVCNGSIYLNHAAVGPMPTYILNAAQNYMKKISEKGEAHWEETTKVMEELRRNIANMLGCGDEEIAFTRNVSGGLSSLSTALNWKEGDNVIVPSIEFPANVYPWMAQRKKGVEIRFVPLNKGIISIDDIARRIDRKTRVVSVSAVQFYNGFMINLRKLGELCREKEVLFVVDAIQYLGAAKLNVKNAMVDFLVCGAHKWFMAGEGMGFLYCRRKLAERLYPVLVGWRGVKNWEDFLDYDLDFLPGALRFETGNLSAMGIHTLNASIDFLEKTGYKEIECRIKELSQMIIEKIKSNDYLLVTQDDGQFLGIVSFKIPGRSSQKIVEELKRRKIHIAFRNGVLRVSPHFYNTFDEINELFANIEKIVNVEK